MNKELKKIIYFDENSATDLVYVKFDGKVLETHTNKKDSQHKVGVEIKPELPEIFKLIGNISKWKLPLKVGKFGYEYNRESEKIINKVVSNTVLTDYLKISKNDNDIKKFENIKLSIYPNSLAFFKLITPYMAMTDGEFGDENLKINIAMRMFCYLMIFTFWRKKKVRRKNCSIRLMLCTKVISRLYLPATVQWKS